MYDEEAASVISCNYTEEVDLTEKILEIFPDSHCGLNVILTHALLANQPVYFSRDS